jgi:hypothetical protein
VQRHVGQPLLGHAPPRDLERAGLYLDAVHGRAPARAAPGAQQVQQVLRVVDAACAGGAAPQRLAGGRRAVAQACTVVGRLGRDGGGGHGLGPFKI